jgi:hypothetical protein
MLVAAASRPGAAALLEVLSTRVVPGPLGGDPAAGRSSAAPVTREIGVSEAVRVETPAARVDVLAPADVAAPPLGELAGRLLAALGEEGGDGAVRILGVDLGSHRLIVHPVPGHGRPPRFVALVGGPELPGLLGRRAERAARTFREVS